MTVCCGPIALRNHACTTGFSWNCSRGAGQRVQQLCARYLVLYPHSEQAVQDQLAACVHAKNGAGLQNFLHGLRDRPVLLTARTLAWVRAFRKEDFS